jgi:mannose-6-phosphate isomerase
VHEVRGVVQHYAWGDQRFIPDLLGVPPDGRPWAELWLGTHPNGPATLAGGGPLEAMTGRLPYLLKVLAAAEPLSLQAHPSRTQAEAGFAAGRYPDPEPKPELLCALTSFEAFCGIRPVDATLELLGQLGAADLARVVAGYGPGEAMTALYHGRLAVGPVVGAAAGSDRPEARWATQLAARYPGDPSVAVTLLLNLVQLRPGEAIRLGPGNLHAYLGGAGIELMGASDNVVRGGLTVKPVDIDDLLAVVDPTPLAEPVLPAGDRYDLPEAGVALQRIAPGATHTAHGHELAIDLDGTTVYLAPGDGLVAEAVTYVVTPM